MARNNANEKRKRILNAAETCLRENGLNALNIRDIAKEAGVSLGTVHYYFDYKEHILMELFRQFVYRVTNATFNKIQGTDPKKFFVNLVDEFFAELSRDPESCHIFIDLWGHVSKHEDLRKLLDSYYRRSMEFITGLIKEGKDKGVFQVKSPAFAAAHIIAILDGLKVLLHLFESEFDLERMRAACKIFILRALQVENIDEIEEVDVK